MHLLNRHGVQGIYEVKGLSLQSARRVFCLKAFKQGKPNEEYSELCKEVVEYTQGLPLAVEVLGSYLYGRNVDFWHDTIRELRSGPPFEIHKVLKISYEHLGPAEKNIFLDIACFFKGWNKGKVVRILKMCNLYVGIGSEIGSGIVNLIDKSLVTLDQNDGLEMHDLLQEMGRHIVYEESPNNPGKRSRLWFIDDIDQVLTNDMGRDAIQGIALSSDHEAYWNPGAFLKTVQLKFLRLSAIKLPHGLNYLPRSLKVLHWNRCPLETLPLVDQSYQVVEMILICSNLKQLWYDKKFLTMLKYLDLSDSKQLKETPDLSAVPILETLILKYCKSLTEIHPSLVQHKKLVLLDLSYCGRLETLPGKLEMSSLEELILSGCMSLANLPEFGECMKHLSTLSLCGCESLVSLPGSINQLKSLRILDAGGCLKLRRLPSSVSSLSLLSILDLSFCNLSSFPDDFCNLSSLTDLDLIGNPLSSLPTSFHNLAKLRCLSISACPNIRVLPELPSSIRELHAEECDSLHMTELLFLSESCNISASTSYKHGQVFIKLIPGSEIPSDYSVNQEDDNCISLPRLDNCLLNEELGIDLCFLLETFESCHDVPELSLALYWNGKRFTSRKMSPEMGPGRYRYFFVLKSDYTSDHFHEGDRFELSIKDGPISCVKILGSAARWFCSDIEMSEETLM